MNRRSSLILITILAVAAIALAPSIGANDGGVVSGDREYGCGGSCHPVTSTSVILMSASNLTPAPGGTVTVWVNVSGGQVVGEQLGVMIICAMTTSNSLPSADGWIVLTDPSGTTDYNYHQVPSYTASASLSWQLSAPNTIGTHMLYASVLHGDDASRLGRSVDYAAGILFTVTEFSEGGGDGTSSNIPTLVITSPSNSATVRGDMTINANVVSTDAIVSATLKIDGVVFGQLTAPPFTWTINTTTLTEGGHVIVVTVVDETGDTVSKEIAVFVDNENELISMLEWVVTMGAGVVAIICVSGMAVILALYVRKRIVERGSR